MDELYWVWIMLAAIFAVAELIERGWFIGPWAFGAAAAAVSDMLGLSALVQWASLILISCIVFIVIRRVFYPASATNNQLTGSDPEEPSPEPHHR